MSDRPSIQIPQHIAFVMDGNRRWAKKWGLPSLAGHTKGYETAREIVRACSNRHIPFVTLYTFSTENWKREREEVDYLMNLLRHVFTKEIEGLMDEGVRIRAIGNTELFPDDIREIIHEAEENTKQATSLTVNLALSYGGRDEIIAATKRLIRDRQDPEDIDESLFSSYLTTKGQPDPDLMIRTGGDHRLSNFLLWQLSYAELHFSSVLWPDFHEEQLESALQDFARRARRFGK